MEITADMLKPVTDSINSGLTTLVPIGLGIMGTMIGHQPDPPDHLHFPVESINHF